MSFRTSRTVVSIVIPTADRLDLLRGTILSCLNQNYSPDLYELIIVDNGVSQLAQPLVEELSAFTGRQILYVREPRPGLHYGRHTGADHARGRIVLYGDDDIIASRDWVQRIVDCYKDVSVGAAGGKVIAKWQGEVPEWVSALGDPKNCGLLSLLDLGEGLLSLDRRHNINGCNFSVRLDVLRMVGGSNPDAFPQTLERYSGDGESGLLDKIYKAGYRIMYSSAAQVEHVIPPSRLPFSYAINRLRTQGVRRAYTRSRACGGDIFCLGWDWLVCTALGMGAKLSAKLTKCAQSRNYFTMRAEYLRSRGRHSLAIATDRNLREYSLRETYWD